MRLKFVEEQSQESKPKSIDIEEDREDDLKEESPEKVPQVDGCSDEQAGEDESPVHIVLSGDK